MVSELSAMDSDHISARLNSKNYALWEFQFRIYIEGKGLLSMIDGSSSRPIVPPATAQALLQWQQNDAGVKTALLNSVEKSIVLGLRTLPTAADMWRNLAETYGTTSVARQFDLEIALSQLQQGDWDIASYYNEARQLWTEQDLVSTALMPSGVSEEARAEKNRIRLLHFLARLRPEYEALHAPLIHRDSLKMEGVLGALLQEETRLRTQSVLDVKPSQGDASIFAVGGSRLSRFVSTPHAGRSGPAVAREGQSSPAPAVPNDETYDSAFAALRPQFQRRSDVECHHCHLKGHTQKFCWKRNWCVYCKKDGHIIPDFPSLQVRVRDASSSSGGSSQARPAFATQPAESVGSDVVTPGALEQLVSKAVASAFASLQVSGKPLPWILDSACFNHTTERLSALENVHPGPGILLQVANGNNLTVEGEGTVSQPAITLPSTFHVPALVPNLVSVGQLTDQNCWVVFAPSGCSVQDLTTGREIGRGSKYERIFHLEKLDAPPPVTSSSSLVPSVSRLSPCLAVFSRICDKNFHLWHSRLGHPNSGRLATMFRPRLFGDNVIGDSSDFFCTCCVEAKATRSSFPSSQTVIVEPFHIIHTDLWGPSPVTSRHGYKYFALFVDHATRYIWVYFLRLKSDLLVVATYFITMIQTQFSIVIRVIRADEGGEFSSHPLL
ncbi:unnamed protein product [Linum trigynum]|uniref:Integrase catalytic domain-containing protein n=1 Tax=Linum trigynum TaxID=586398 RepID=A0AAV2DD31_9ROSI